MTPVGERASVFPLGWYGQATCLWGARVGALEGVFCTQAEARAWVHSKLTAFAAEVLRGG